MEEVLLQICQCFNSYISFIQYPLMILPEKVQFDEIKLINF